MANLNGSVIRQQNLSGTVNVGSGRIAPNLQTKTGINPSTSSQTITASVGYDGLASVQINAMPTGSVSAPIVSGTYNPTISVNSSTGVITATVSGSKAVTQSVAAGYVSSVPAGSLTVSGSATQQLSTRAASTIHPSTSDQTISSGMFLTGTQTFKAVQTSGLAASNIVEGVVVKVGDADDDDSIAYVVGTASSGGGGSNYQVKQNIDPTESSMTIEADSGFDALRSVQINAIPSDYVGSSITERDGDDLIASGATVSVPAGFYEEAASKTIASGTTDRVSLTFNALTGHIEATANVAAGYYGAQVWESDYDLSTQAAQTIHPSTSNQVITEHQYLLGDQTIKAVTLANLTAGNIKSGVTVKVGDSDDDDRIASVTGTYSGGGITPTGSITITSNTTTDVTNYASAITNVPNTYAAGDEGKVVSNGALVSQTSATYTANNTYDTTLINSVTVNVSGGGASVATGTFTPTERVLTVTFDTGLSTVNNVLILPTSETPLKSNGRTVYYFFGSKNTFIKGIRGGSNSAGSGTLAPQVSTSDYFFTQSGTEVTAESTAGNGGYFETVSYTWWAW